VNAVDGGAPGDGDDSALHRRSIAAHARALRRGDYSSVELTRHFLDRIAAADALNAFITVTEELAAGTSRGSRPSLGER